MIKLDVPAAGRLASGMREAAGELGNLDPLHKRIATEWAGRAARRAPMRTGLLSRSIEPAHNGAHAGVEATAKHAPFVHWGTRYVKARPFITDTATPGAWLDRYAAYIDNTLGEIQ